ncbi:hypothetical protein [Actinoplanes derwentensis]|uniref:hypothetical protein n=1 Tax=Actinoplanes derwentensis TaxID=113562 RepID=UPI0012FDB3FF|nr:hypothetical protein [Actinoplanes derwentensis]
MTSACTDPPESTVVPVPSSSLDPAVLRDDVHAGITVEDRGFATFPVRNGDAKRRIVGAAGVFRNVTDEPMRIHVRFRFVDAAGRGWRSETLNDWEAIVNIGYAILPARQTIEIGGVLQVDAESADRVAGIVMYVLEDALPPKPFVLLPARVTELKPAPASKDEWDYVSFEVDNPGLTIREPDYGMVYRSAEGRLIGGWFGSHALWSDIDTALPEGESERYRQGTSRHTMPTWLPPGIKPDRVTMYVWR